MEPITILLILLILVVPLVAGIWLIAHALDSRNRIEELTLRVDALHLELTKLKRSTAAPAKTTEEKIAGFMPASAPLQSEEEATAPPPVIFTETATGVSDFQSEISPVSDFRHAEPPPFHRAVPEAGAPMAQTSKPTVNLPPPSVPPPFVPKAASQAGPMKPSPFRRAGAVPGAPAAADKSSFEMRLGTYWLVRVGVIMLLAGLAFFANYAYHNLIGKLGPGGKIFLLYLASGLLLGAGAWWQRRHVKESLKNYAQVLFAGGLAAVYFTTYAAHHIPPLQVISSALADGILLFAWAGVIAWIADRRKSEVMALFAVGLAFFTSVITRVGEFTLYSNLILTLAAGFFLVRNRWAGLSFASLVTSYAGYIFWRFLHGDGWRWAAPGENLWLGAGFLACYWLVFTAATFLSKSEKLSGPSRAAFLTLNNGAYFALFLLTMLQVHTGGFWKFSLIYGSVLLALAALASQFLPAEPVTKNSYLTHGLVLVTLGFISKFAGLQLALVLGAESAVLYVLATQRQSNVLKFFAYAAALLAAGWCEASLRPFDAQGRWTGAGLGAMLAFNAVWAHLREKVLSSPSSLSHPSSNPIIQSSSDSRLLRAEPTAFTLLACALWLATTWFNTTEANLPLALAAEAVALTFSIYLLRVPEITLLGQFFLIFAQLAWLFHYWNVTPPWWHPLLIIAVTLGLSHWWQHQKALVISRNLFVCYSTVFALAAVAVVLVWLHPLLSPPAWLAVTSLLAVAVTGYGLLIRAWILAICGQVFLGVSAWEFLAQLLHEQPDWYFPLAPLAVLAALSFATVAWFAREPQANPRVREPLLQVALVYRWLALALALLWIWDYVPERQRVWTCMSAAAAMFAAGWWRISREALVAAAVYAAASLSLLWLRENLAMDLYAPNLLALLALLVMQQLLRRRAARMPLDEGVHGALVIIAGVSLWRFLSCWTAQINSGFSMTMTWAGFAVVVFTAGILLRERFLRWFGLGVLAGSVGRVVLVDVWNEATIYRVLTFMALGVALLVVGFIYTKYQEKIRQWL